MNHVVVMNAPSRAWTYFRCCRFLLSVVALMNVAITGSAFAQSGAGEERAVEEIVVTGSHIRRRDGFEERVNIAVVSRDEIDAAGYLTIQDIVADSTVNTGSLQVDSEGALTGTSQFNIRGLGIGSTLTLINGRRGGAAPVSNATGAAFFDVNVLPLSMVQRVDLLTDGASATYGSDAVAGVANIVTRKGFEGFEATAEYHDSANSAHAFSFASGVSTDRGVFNLYGSYYSQDGNERKDFDWMVDRLNGGVQNYFESRDLAVLDGGMNSGTGSPGSYAQALVDPVTGAITHSGGGRVPDPHCYEAGGVPGGTSCRFNFFDQRSALPYVDRTQVFGEMEFDITETITFFAEANFAHNITHNTHGPQSYGNGLIGGLTYIPGDHPFNFMVAAPTADDPYAISYRGPDVNGNWSNNDQADWQNGLLQAVDLACECRPLGDEYNAERSPYPRRRLQVDFMRYMVGVGLELPGEWSADLAFQNAVYDRVSTSPYSYRNNLYTTAIVDGTWNPFGSRIALPDFVSPKDGVSDAENDRQLLDTIVGTSVSTDRYEQKTADLIATGSLFELAGRPIDAAVGYQYRENELVLVPDTASASGNGNFPELEGGLDGKQTAHAYFAELFVPVADAVDLQLAARHEDYGHGVTTTDPKVSMRWQAMDWLALRGNYGSSFQAPSLRQTAPSTSSAFVNDTCTPGAPTANIGVTTVGDGDLEPQTADNTSFGVILQPRDHLTLSIDYWVYDYKNLISGGESPQAIVNADCEDGISDDPRISRHAGTGQIDGVTVSARNIGAVKTSGFDLRLAYEMDLQRLGLLNFSAEATNILKFDAQATPDSPVVDAAGSRNAANDASDFGPTPELRANARVNWMTGLHSVDAIVRYIDSYEEDVTGGVVDSFVTLDLQYGLSTALFGEETRFAVGVNNVFDEDPPSIGLRNRPGFDAFVHSPIGREVYVRITQSF